MYTPNSDRLQKIDSNFVPALNTIKEIIDTFQIESLRRELSIIQRYAQAEGASEQYIDIVVLGQFKAGKSSLINSVIGENILPVGILPVTSIITRLQYAADKKASISFINGTLIDIKTDEIDDYITESKNPKNIKQVGLVDIYLPQLYQYQSIRIIDTPGIGSYFKHNSNTAIQWLPEIGLALLVISVERPMGEDDVLLLKNIKRYSSETKIILTKSDLVSKDQLQEVIEYISNSLVSEGLKNNLILSYSTIMDNDGNRKILLEKVFLPLKENYSANFVNIFQYKIKSILLSCLSYLKVGLESSYKTEIERDKLSNAIIEEHLKFQTIRNELEIIFASYRNKCRDTVAEIVMPYSQEICDELATEFQNEYYTWQGNLYKLTAKFELWMQNKLNMILKDYSDKAILQLDVFLKDIQNHFNLFATTFAERLSNNVEKILNIKFNIMAVQTEVEKIKQPDISISSSFDIHIDLLWFLFPMFIFKPLFKTFFKNKIPYETEKNLSRLTSDIAENIIIVIEQNKKQVTKYIYNELKTIENLIKNRKNESSNYNQSIKDIEALLFNLEASLNN
jgi:GTP-binding protein EngB required for normal cell division